MASSFPVDGCRFSDVESVCSTVPSDFSFPVSFKDASMAVSMLPSDGSMSDMSVPVMASHSSLVNFFFVTIHFLILIGLLTGLGAHLDSLS